MFKTFVSLFSGRASYIIILAFQHNGDVSLEDYKHYRFYCFTVHSNSLNVTHQLMHFQYNNILL